MQIGDTSLVLEAAPDFGGLARVKQAHIFGRHFEPRIAGPVGDPNFFAQMLIPAVPIALLLAQSASSVREKALAFGSAAVVTAAVVLTYSRGGALALGVVLGLWLLGQGVSARRLAVAGGAVLVRSIDNKIFAFGEQDGKRRWVYQRAPSALLVRSPSGLAVLGDLVFAGFSGGKLAALTIGNGAVRWEATVALPKGSTELERVTDVIGSVARPV